MLDNLPKQYRKDPWITELAEAIGGELTEQAEQMDSLLAQMSLNTVTWNLEVEERIAGISPSPGTSLEDRRSALKAKWRSSGKVDLEQIQAVADSWKNGETSVDFSAGSFVVKFIGAFGIPDDIDALKRAVGLVIPCHLPVEYLIRYILIREIQAMTLDELRAYAVSEFAFGGAQ